MAFPRKISRPAHSIFSDLSDISLDDSKMEDLRNLKVSRSLTQAAPGQSRFLKRSQTTGEKHLDLKENAVLDSGTRLAVGRPLTTASKIRASAALMKLAQIETKIRSRQRAHTSLSDTESDSKPSEDSLPGGVDAVTAGTASGPSSLHAHRTSQKQARESPIPRSSVQTGQVSRFLKREPRVQNAAPEARAGKETNLQMPRPKEPAPKFDSPDSDEEEMKELLGSLMESSREEASVNQRFTKVREKERVKPFTDQIPAAPRAPSLPSAEPPSSGPQTPRPPPARPARRSLRSARSRACSPRTSASPAASTSIPDTGSRSESSKMGRTRLASSRGGSAPGPGEASASEAADDDDADSLNDFRINILSIDDLTPAISEKSDLEQKEGAAPRPRPPGRSCPDQAPAGLEVPPRAPPRGSAFQGKATSAAGDEGLPTESEVSEHLSASSASAAQPDSVSPSETPGGSSVGLAYSEDFESPSPVASEATAAARPALERALATASEGSSSLRAPARREWGRGVARVTVKETAVQTLDPAFTYQWTAAAGVAAMGPALGGTYVDPAPVASHVISADAIEVLTAYSPAALALNDMLRQQLSLTRQFMEAARHLHGSLLQSMDGDVFHYHTLEEAKEYIRRHRPRPLTMEDALQEVKEGL